MLQTNYIIACIAILITFLTSCENSEQNNKNSEASLSEIDQFDLAIDEYSFSNEELKKEFTDSLRFYYAKNSFKPRWITGDSSKDRTVIEFYEYLNNDTLLNIPLGHLSIPQNLENKSPWHKEIHLFLRCTAYLNTIKDGIYNFKDTSINKPNIRSFILTQQFIEKKSKKKSWIDHLIEYEVNNKDIIKLHKAINEFSTSFVLKEDPFNLDTSFVDSSLNLGLSYYGYMLATDSSERIKNLKNFQYSNGLEADGVIGKNTLAAFEKSNLERYYQSIITLDQLRQFSDSILPKKNIRVNIPSFLLKFTNEDTLAFESRVVVGAKKTKTKSFQTKAKYIVTNPYWHVPHSIASKEIVYGARRDSNLFNKKGYELLKNNKVINHDSIDWFKYNKNYFPFRIRQKFGPLNSLGKVKLLFPNPYMIYIHDTPSKRLFNTSVRAYSHGCIRTENPDSLAKLILQFEDHTYIDSIDSLYHRDKETYLRLNDQFTVSIEYQSVIVDDSTHRLIVYPDIYGRLTDFIELSKQ